MDDEDRAVQERIALERETLLERIQGWLEVPMLILAMVWLALFVIEVVGGSGPGLSAAVQAIWILFILEYLLNLVLAPRKLAYVTRNWLKGIALLAPALRVFRVVTLLRVARAARLARGLRLLRLLSSVNRGMRALGASMSRRGFGYILALTLLVIVAGAAGIYSFERDTPAGIDFASYWEAVWWTAMLLTAIGPESWPQTTEGRLLCFGLALYGLGVFGYVTAALASFFIGWDADADTGEIAGERSVAALQAEIAALRKELHEAGGAEQ